MTRHDDIPEFIRQAEIRRLGKSSRHKIEQWWHGEVAIELPAGTTADDVDAAIDGLLKNGRWKIRVDAIRHDVWVKLRASYRAVGANADDTKRIAAALGVDQDKVAVDTDHVEPVGDKP